MTTLFYQVFSDMESIVDKLATDYQHQSKMLNYFLGNKTSNNITNNSIQSACVYIVLLYFSIKKKNQVNHFLCYNLCYVVFM
jgi:hypothetical protein